jgi:hypothetical protein
VTETRDPLIPASVVLTRLEGHLERMRSELEVTPRWRVRRRLILAGACSAYRYEIEELLRITGSWQPVWPTRPPNVHVEPPTGIRHRR